MIAKDGSVKITDFGLARNLKAASKFTTVSGAFMGGASRPVHRPPRHQAGEHHDREGRLGEDHRLRPGAEPEGGQQVHDGERRVHGRRFTPSPSATATSSRRTS